MTVQQTTVDRDFVIARQASRESSARTYARTLTMVPVEASGMTVRGADGRADLDYLSGAGTLALGHNHPVVVEAALKLTRTATGRQSVAAFTGAYHGMTAGALAVSGGVAAKTPMAGTATAALRLPFPYEYRCPFGVGEGRTTDLSARYVERPLDDSNGGVVEPAAMIFEVVQGEGGVIPAPHEWVREMRRITADRDIPLAITEVQTGVGRTGTFWASQAAEIEPDVMVLSTAIGGTLPLAVVVYSDHLDTWQPGAHAGTFRGTTLAMAAGAAILRYVRENALHQRAAGVGGRILGELRNLAGQHDCIGDVRGRGLNVELGGRHDTVVRLLPPLVITDEEVSTVLERLAEAIAAAEKAVAG